MIPFVPQEIVRIMVMMITKIRMRIFLIFISISPLRFGGRRRRRFEAAGLPDRLFQKKFHFGVDAPEFVRRPFFQGVVELGVEPKEEFLFFAHV
jgi:hypothetical protein